MPHLSVYLDSITTIKWHAMYIIFYDKNS